MAKKNRGFVNPKRVAEMAKAMNGSETRFDFPVPKTSDVQGPPTLGDILVAQMKLEFLSAPGPVNDANLTGPYT